MKREDIGFFDRDEAYSVVGRVLPHWAKAGTICFVTWRAADSLPQSVLTRLDREIADVLRKQGLDPNGHWKQELAKRSRMQRGQTQWKLFATRDKYLDEGHGECLLATATHSEIVEQSLRHFDEERYFLTDAVVMPNHVHFLVAFRDEEALLKQNAAWKRFTARQINTRVGRSGEFWQVDQFDHLVRSLRQFEHYRRYIADNPKNAGLTPDQFRHFQKDLCH